MSSLLSGSSGMWGTDLEEPVELLLGVEDHDHKGGPRHMLPAPPHLYNNTVSYITEQILLVQNMVLGRLRPLSYKNLAKPSGQSDGL